MERDLLWCEDCKQSLPGDCEEHGPLQHVADRPVSPRAIKTAPKLIDIALITPDDHRDGGVDSTSASATVGAFASCPIPSRTCFGPFEADTILEAPKVDRTRLLLKRFRGGKECGYLDVRNDYVCNWLIYVRPAREECQINVVAFLYKDEIYYCTSRTISAREELRVWYADEYARLMGVKSLTELADVDESERSADRGQVAPLRQSHVDQLDDGIPGLSPNSLDDSGFGGSHTEDRLPGRRKTLRPQRIQPTSILQIEGSVCSRGNATDTSSVKLSRLIATKLIKSEDDDQGKLEASSGFVISPFNQEPIIWSSDRAVAAKEDYVAFPSQSSSNGLIHPLLDPLDEEGESTLLSDNLRSPQSSSLDSEQESGTAIRSCSDCGEQFACAPSRRSHMIRLHGGNRASHVCSFPFCRKVFTSKYKLLRHELIHSQEKRHHCPLCHKKFHRKDHLNNHLKVHERSKVRLECHLCGCVFAKKWTYDKHMTLHERIAQQNGDHEMVMQLTHAFDEDDPETGDGEDDHDEDTYSNSRPVRETMANTYLTYLPDIKPLPASQKPSHPCDVCGKVFSASKDLRRHLQTHLGVKPNLCPYCPKKFTRKDHVRRHVSTVHAAEFNGRKKDGKACPDGMTLNGAEISDVECTSEAEDVL